MRRTEWSLLLLHGLATCQLAVTCIARPTDIFILYKVDFDVAEEGQAKKKLMGVSNYLESLKCKTNLATFGEGQSKQKGYPFRRMESQRLPA